VIFFGAFNNVNGLFEKKAFEFALEQKKKLKYRVFFNALFLAVHLIYRAKGILLKKFSL